MCFETYRKFSGSDLYCRPYQKLTDLQTTVLRVIKAPKVASMVEFLSSEAGANGFSTEQLLQTTAKTLQESMHVVKRTSS